jgi:hypothetical protein
MNHPSLRRRAGTTAVVAAFALVVGLLVGILIGGPFDVALFEAVGTWLGSLATVGAVIWGVRVFQHEQAIRRAEEAARMADRYALLEREEAVQQEAERGRRRQILEEAALVTMIVFGGGGHGQPDQATMTEFTVQVTNATQKLVTRVHVWVPGGVEGGDGSVHGLDQAEFDVRNLTVGETSTWIFRGVEIRGIPISQWSGKPMTALPVAIQYRIDGRIWRRILDHQPQDHTGMSTESDISIPALP